MRETELADVADEEPQEEAQEGRRWDKELLAISAVLRVLNSLPEPARSRVVVYVADRYAEGLKR